MKNYRQYFLIIFIFLSYCSSKNFKENYSQLTFDNLEQITPNKFSTSGKAHSSSKIEEKIKIFEKRLRSEKPLSKDSWLLHDELLADYIRIKSSSKTDGTNLTIPAQSKITLNFTSFCLNPNKASPSNRETYSWKEGDPEIPYFQDIIRYASTNKNTNQHDIQSLLWNLQQGADFEDYPVDQKILLRKFDTNVSFKLPSRTKKSAQSKIKNFIHKFIPISNEVENKIDDFKSTYINYKDIAEDIKSLTSNEPLDNSNQPEVVIPNQLYADTQSDGYSNQTITFYNPTNQNITFDTSHFYLQPRKQDVQRIALFPNAIKNSDSGIISKLEKVLFGDMLRLGIGFTPGLNDVADAYEAITGKDFVSGGDLTLKERLFSTLGLIIGSGSEYRYLNRFANSPLEYVDDFERGLSRASGKSLSSIDQEAIRNIANEANDLIKSGEIGSASQIAIHDLSGAFRSSNLIEKESSFINAMDISTLRKEVAETYTPEFKRFYGGGSPEYSNWLMDSETNMSKSSIREAFQLPPENTMDYVTSFKIKEGTIFYSSKVSGGSGRQIFLFDPIRNLIKVK